MSSSIVVSKLYTDQSTKPTYLTLAETLQITLSSSMAFVSALSLNNLITNIIEDSIKNSLTTASEMSLRVAYVLTALVMLFVFNIVGARIVSVLRSRAQYDAAMRKSDDKK